MLLHSAIGDSRQWSRQVARPAAASTSDDVPRAMTLVAFIVEVWDDTPSRTPTPDAAVVTAVTLRTV